METGALFLDYSIRKLEQLSSWISQCLDTMTEEQIWMRLGEASNAPGNLVLHLSGNVRQWIIAGLGDQPDLRDRDAEFAARGGLTRDELKARLTATVEEAIGVLRGFPAGRLPESRRIQGYDVTAIEAVYQVVQHFALHAGQIVFAAKAVSNRDFGFYSHLSSSNEGRVP